MDMIKTWMNGLTHTYERVYCTGTIYSYAQLSIHPFTILTRTNIRDIHSIDNRNIGVFFIKNLGAHMLVQFLNTNEIC